MIKLYPWDPAEDLETEEDMAEYLEAAFEQDDDSWGVAYVLSDISRAKGMERAIESAWRDKKSIHKAEKRGDILTLRAVMDAARALGLRLYADAAKTRRLTQSPNCKPAEDTVSRLSARPMRRLGRGARPSGHRGGDGGGAYRSRRRIREARRDCGFRRLHGRGARAWVADSRRRRMRRDGKIIVTERRGGGVHSARNWDKN